MGKKNHSKQLKLILVNNSSTGSTGNTGGFFVESVSPTGFSGPIPVNDGETLRFISSTLNISVETGSANVNINSIPVPPVGPTFLYTESTYTGTVGDGRTVPVVGVVNTLVGPAQIGTIGVGVRVFSGDVIPIVTGPGTVQTIFRSSSDITNDLTNNGFNIATPGIYKVEWTFAIVADAALLSVANTLIGLRLNGNLVANSIGNINTVNGTAIIEVSTPSVLTFTNEVDIDGDILLYNPVIDNTTDPFTFANLSATVSINRLGPIV